MVKIMENHIKMDDLGGKPTIFGNMKHPYKSTLPGVLKSQAPHLLWPATWYPKDLLLTSPLPKSWMDYDEADLGCVSRVMVHESMKGP